MKPHRRLVVGLGAGLGLAIAGVVFLAAQLRSRYEKQLFDQVWPAGGAVVLAAPGGGLQPTILLLGDSRIALWNLPPPAAGRIVKAGLAGATTARILLTAPKFLEEYRPNVVVIEAGINDIKLAGMRPDLRAQIVDEAFANLARLAADCRASGARVLVLEVWPASDPELLRRPVWNAAAIASAVAELNSRLRSLNGPGVTVCDLFAGIGGSPAYRDALHLQPATYERLTSALQTRIRDLTTVPLQP